MATVNDSDFFLVNRSNTTKKLQAQDLMAELLDDDLMLVNRSDVTYKATGADIKASLKPPAEVIKPQIIAPDGTEEPDPSGINFVGSTFASSDGTLTAGSADWQVTTLADTGYSSIVSQVDKHPDMGPPPVWTSGALEGDTEYRARTKYYAASGEESAWSDDITFKTKQNKVLTAVPSEWVINKNGTMFSTKKLLNAFATGNKKFYGGVAIDGTVTFSKMPDQASNWFAGPPDDETIVSAGTGYGYGFWFLTSEGNLYVKDGLHNVNAPPTSNVGFTKIADQVYVAGAMGSVINAVHWIDLNGDFYCRVFEDNLPAPNSVGWGTNSLRLNQIYTSSLSLPDGQKPKELVGISGRGYSCYGFLVLTDSGKLYIFGKYEAIGNDALGGAETGGTAASPIDVTPPGKTFVNIGCSPGAYAGSTLNYSGCMAVSTDGQLYGFAEVTSPNHSSLGPLPYKPYAAPLPLWDDSATYVSATMGYMTNLTTKLYRVTRENGVEYGQPDDPVWKKVPGSVAEGLGDYLGSYALNSGHIPFDDDFIFAPTGN